MDIVKIISKKREGEALSGNELAFFTENYYKNTISDTEASALLMAMHLRGLGDQELIDFTRLMAVSNNSMKDLKFEEEQVDMISVGGMSDHAVFLARILAAACGCPVGVVYNQEDEYFRGMMGKLSALPGFSTKMPEDVYIHNLKHYGIAVLSPENMVAPIERKISHLRERIGLDSSPMLSICSVISMGIAAGKDKLLIDVKAGKDSFLKTLDAAVDYGNKMIQVGKQFNKPVTVIVTDADSPIGRGVGNFLELSEIVDVLNGAESPELTDVGCFLAAQMLSMCGKGSFNSSLFKVKESITSGKALKKFKTLLKVQGSHYSTLMKEREYLTQVVEKRKLIAGETGYITNINMDLIEKAGDLLGIYGDVQYNGEDTGAGIELKKKTGDFVNAGEILAYLHTNRQGALNEAVGLLRDCFAVKSNITAKRKLILAKIDQEQTVFYNELNGAEEQRENQPAMAVDKVIQEFQYKIERGLTEENKLRLYKKLREQSFINKD